MQQKEKVLPWFWSVSTWWACWGPWGGWCSWSSSSSSRKRCRRSPESRRSTRAAHRSRMTGSPEERYWKWNNEKKFRKVGKWKILLKQWKLKQFAGGLKTDETFICPRKLENYAKMNISDAFSMNNDSILQINFAKYSFFN